MNLTFKKYTINYWFFFMILRTAYNINVHDYEIIKAISHKELSKG